MYTRPRRLWGQLGPSEGQLSPGGRRLLPPSLLSVHSGGEKTEENVTVINRKAIAVTPLILMVAELCCSTLPQRCLYY